MPEDFLTAAQLAELTGVAQGTLRVWETRYGFPVARRLPGNHKRYTSADAAQILAVLEQRREGLSLVAAIQRVRHGGSQVVAPERPRSIFGALREARPDLAVRVHPKPALLALSRAVEDEHAARATGGLLFGAFQRERHYRASERRWLELATSAELTVAMADFREPRRSPAGPNEVPLVQADPLEREWTVIVHSPAASACLAAWEVPTPRPLPESERSFELIWTSDPTAVHIAALAATQILTATSPDVAARIPATVLAPPASNLSNLGFSDDLAARAFDYLISGPAGRPPVRSGVAA